MWILPKQLHTSHFVPDTAALISDLDEQSQICEPSLLARSKPSLARTWSQRWKRDSWTQHLSGRILKPSHGQSFVTAWTSSLEVIPASRSQQQASDLEQKIHDISGHLSQPELFPCDPESASSRTLKDTSASDSERSLANWKALVIKRRGEYSLRVKSAHLINASGSLSWPTTRSVDWKGCGNAVPRKDGQHRLDTLEAVVIYGHPSQQSWPTPCAMEAEKAGFHAKGQMGQSLSAMAYRGELQWLTPATVQIQRADMQKRINYRASIGRKYVPGSLEEQMQQHGQAVPVSPSTDGNRLESSQEGRLWMTPKSGQCGMTATTSGRPLEKATQLTTQVYVVNRQESWATPRTGATDNSRPNNKGGIPLGDQARRAEQWPTPMGQAQGVTGNIAGNSDFIRKVEQIEGMRATPNGPKTGLAKLNPRWVETLMGLPIGWTMPSCSSPLTIAPTNSGCLATESCQPPQPELF